MKEKIKYLILGILIGVVITAGVFIVLKNNTSNKMPGMRPDMNFEDFDGNFPSDRPEMPDKDGESSSEKRERPSKRDEEKESSADASEDKEASTDADEKADV